MGERQNPLRRIPLRSFRYLPKLRGHALRRLGAGHGSLLKFTSTRTAFAPPGPGAFPFPDFSAPIRSTDSLVSLGLGYGLPLPSAYLGAGASSSPPVPASRGRTVRWRVVTGSPDHRILPRRSEGLPGHWAVPMSRVPWSYTPPGPSPPSPTSVGSVVAFE